MFNTEANHESPPPQESGNKSESGTVLFLILLAVALFAVLSYAVTSSTRSVGGDTSIEQNILLASQLTQYGTILENAIQRMRITNGCTDTQISFENPIITGYTNPAAPANYSCHVFRPEGGGVTYQIPPIGVNILTSSPNSYTLNDRFPYIFSGDHCSLGVGTDGSPADCRTSTSSMELIVYIPILNLNLCNKINEKLGNGITSPPPHQLVIGVEAHQIRVMEDLLALQLIDPFITICQLDNDLLAWRLKRVVVFPIIQEISIISTMFSSLADSNKSNSINFHYLFTPLYMLVKTLYPLYKINYQNIFKLI